MSESRSIAEIVDEAVAAYRRAFGEGPEAVGVAPGRVNIIGDHVDYEGGLVLPMTVNRWIAVALGSRSDNQVHGLSPTHGGSKVVWIPEGENPPAGWLNYVAGVLHGYRERGWEGQGVNIAVASSLPAGAGLSSSAALESATAVALEELGAPTLSATERALLCQKAEHDFAKVPCGIMDQFIVCQGAVGNALLIDCHSLDTESIPLPAEAEFLIVHSGVKHKLGQSEYSKRRAECTTAAKAMGIEVLRQAYGRDFAADLDGRVPSVILRRAQHVVSEIGRVEQFAGAVRDGDLEQSGRLMRESHDSLRDLFEASCRELDLLVELGDGQPEVYGGRMTGGGFGGCAVFLTRRGAAVQVGENLQAGYEKATGIRPQVFRVQPVASASAVSLSAGVL